MSQTFTLPVSAADQFDHGHERRHSRSHLRQSRLAPPFPLPRIPSGAELPPEQALQHESTVKHIHHDHANDLDRTSSYESAGSLPQEKRGFEAIDKPVVMPERPRLVSRPMNLLLHATEQYSLLHGILADQESRRIFYFMLLNLAFMGVQSTYGYLTGSLGLISDSIHMFFDCVALLVGVCAAVMSKWPPSTKFPYGYGKIDTLAGLGNGIFLMLISVEIVYEAIERLFSGSEVQRTSELLLVSIAGLCVNMVGIFAFHGHHGHHGHDHGHSHDHGNSHGALERRPSNAASASPAKQQAVGGHSHGHHHHGENMQGIYLHIMADALGSVAVVLSTLLVQFTGWSGFDPLASCIIAVLIFISTIPLVSSTTKILLLSLNSDIEYNLRDILGGIISIRGVVGYTVPKFWLEDIKKDGYDHDHDHDHDHSHPHSHDHEPKHDHNYSNQQHQNYPSNISVKTQCSDHSHSHPHAPTHAQAHSHAHDHSHTDGDANPTILGTIHIQISTSASLPDVQRRVTQYFRDRKMDVVVQYEREGETKCWCSATNIGAGYAYSNSAAKTPMTGGKTPSSGSFSGMLGQGPWSVSTSNLGAGKGSPLGKML